MRKGFEPTLAVNAVGGMWLSVQRRSADCRWRKITAG
jgi:hypothetical protein